MTHTDTDQRFDDIRNAYQSELENVKALKYLTLPEEQEAIANFQLRRNEELGLELIAAQIYLGAIRARYRGLPVSSENMASWVKGGIQSGENGDYEPNVVVPTNDQKEANGYRKRFDTHYQDTIELLSLILDESIK